MSCRLAALGGMIESTLTVNARCAVSGPLMKA